MSHGNYQREMVTKDMLLKDWMLLYADQKDSRDRAAVMLSTSSMPSYI